MGETGQGMDFLDCLGPDTSATVFTLLDDPADLARASAVSRSWRRFVIENQFSKIQCLRAYPEVATFTDIEVSSSGGVGQDDRTCSRAEFEKLESSRATISGRINLQNLQCCRKMCCNPLSCHTRFYVLVGW